MEICLKQISESAGISYYYYNPCESGGRARAHMIDIFDIVLLDYLITNIWAKLLR